MKENIKCLWLMENQPSLVKNVIDFILSSNKGNIQDFWCRTSNVGSDYHLLRTKKCIDKEKRATFVIQIITSDRFIETEAQLSEYSKY